MNERLQKFLSECGIASRRAAEKLIKEGYISVNGCVVRDMGVKVDTDIDIVRYKGAIVKKSIEKVYIMLNKPKGYITTVNDEFKRRTVMELVKGVGVKVYPVGRLDYDSSGLLLLTNDGDFTYRLTHPGHEVNKVYEVRINGFPDENSIEKLRTGVVIDGRSTSPADVYVLNTGENYTVLKFIIHEGRNRQIRKMCSTIGHEVIDLNRVSIGDIKLGNLKAGEWRYLTPAEISCLKSF